MITITVTLSEPHTFNDVVIAKRLQNAVATILQLRNKLESFPSRLVGEVVHGRTGRLLDAAGVKTIGQLISMSRADILALRGIGPVGLEDIENWLSREDLHLNLGGPK